MGFLVLTSQIGSAILSIEVHKLVVEIPFSDFIVGGASIISHL